jgi:hypothetical protein
MYYITILHIFSFQKQCVNYLQLRYSPNHSNGLIWKQSGICLII